MMKHHDQVLDLLQKQIGNAEEVKDISKTAGEVACKWVNPLSEITYKPLCFKVLEF